MDYSFYAPVASRLKIDLLIKDECAELSRRRIRRLLDAGRIRVNGRVVRLASFVPSAGDFVEFDAESPAQKSPTDPVFDPDRVLLRRRGILVYNKPPQVSCQKSRTTELALDDAIRAAGHYVHLVHRLDKETSGVLVLSSDTHHLMEQFRLRRTTKCYLAVVNGLPSSDEFMVSNHLSRISPVDGLVRAVRSGGRQATTRFRVLARSDQFRVSLIECLPESGRSHQIRVHLADQGYGIIGDKKYLTTKARLESPHHLLHAWQLEICLMPGERPTNILAPLPDGFAKMVAKLFPKVEVLS